MNKALIIASLGIVLAALAGCQGNGQWKCTMIDPASASCAESQDGFTWAKENCKFNGSATVCPVYDDQTQQEYQVPVEMINLSAVNRCLKVTATCLEETYVRNTSYQMNISQVTQIK